MPFVYLTKEEIVAINKTFLGRESEIINDGVLDNAAQGPQRAFGGTELAPSLEEKLYALVSPISRNHPFKDGNKRTATQAGLLFLKKNGKAITDQNAFINLINGFADKQEKEVDTEAECADFVARVTGMLVDFQELEANEEAEA